MRRVTPNVTSNVWPYPLTASAQLSNQYLLSRLLSPARNTTLWWRRRSAASATASQGLTLVHFSAQLEPCLTHKNTLHTLNTP